MTDTRSIIVCILQIIILADYLVFFFLLKQVQRTSFLLFSFTCDDYRSDKSTIQGCLLFNICCVSIFLLLSA